MESPRRPAPPSIKQLKFIPAPHGHELVTISSPGTTAVRIAQSLPQTLRASTQEDYKTPPVRLVKLYLLPPVPDQPTGPQTINASQKDILQMWLLFDLDPTALRLLTKGIHGFSQHRPLSREANNNTFYFVASSFTYNVIWTHNSETQSTSGVVVAKRSDIVEHYLEGFWDALQVHSEVLRHPLYPFVALSTQTMDASLDKVSKASRTVGAVLVRLEDDARQLRSLQRATDAFVRDGFLSVTNQAGGAAAEVMTTIRTLQQQMDSWEIHINYIRARAKNQLTVLFNLIARYDAASNIAVAWAAKKDSSSMKSIAVMTMAFLPGTFLAALFTLPSLPAPAQIEFWVYWALAIPVTLFVFGFQQYWSSRESKGTWGLRS
ncbi:hypothetical protein QBC34DRAFT_465825 [Podospora aff. communis PSN243]|uniref:Mg2+ transporter protein, CorA-like/Zinc transport protein ZntB n=1 Tax=Podospora aff. communis PSN243 TaxID=3040156 RepID=A0AAV9GMA1_9PEZI|nr:hypothetical protein QBC34DRAFT_465825 [Podospora aff. communis PSN243]